MTPARLSHPLSIYSGYGITAESIADRKDGEEKGKDALQVRMEQGTMGALATDHRGKHLNLFCSMLHLSWKKRLALPLTPLPAGDCSWPLEGVKEAVASSTEPRVHWRRQCQNQLSVN